MDIFRIFENIQEPILLVDASLNVHWGNSAAVQSLEVSARRLSLRKPLSNFIEFKQGLLAQDQSLSAVETPTPSREIDFVTTGGTTGSGQVSIQSCPDAILSASGSADKLWIVYIRNVTLEKILADKFKAQLDAKEAVIGELENARAELENYSKNLEKMVEARTAELREANRLVSTILNSLGQGIFVFDRKGMCLPFYSKVSERMFNVMPASRPVADVLRLEGSERDTFKKWVEAVFEQMLDFEDLVPLAPSKFNSSPDKHIALDFHPMRNEQNALQGVVLVATDKTAEVTAKREAERERSFAKRIVQIVQHRQQFKSFANEAERITDELVSKLDAKVALDSEEIARHLHTIKGGAASFALLEVAETAHRCEDVLIGYLKNAPNGKLGEWPNALVAQLSSGVKMIKRELGDFIEKHSFLIGTADHVGRTAELPVEVLSGWRDRLAKADQVPAVRAEINHDWVFEPAANSFTHVNSSLVELAQRLGKQLQPISFEGGDIRILPEYFHDLFSTYVHAFRNALDHGLETPEERVGSGKNPAGKLTVRFSRFDEHGRRWFKTEVADDGRGIDAERIRSKLREKNISYDPNWPDEEIIQSVFRDDFSTAAAVTEVSGRGVGLSALQAEAQKMGGRVWITTNVGHGSVVNVVVPDCQDALAELPASKELKRVG